MTTIFERVTTALNTLGVPYALGQYLTENGSDLPDTFLVYSLVDGLPEQHAEDAETMRGYRVQVSIYDRTGLVSLPDVDSAMLAAGFEKSVQVQLPYDEQSRHFGLATDYVYLDEAA